MRVTSLRRRAAILLLIAVPIAIASCMAPQDTGRGERHRWWAGLGPVIPHDTFPADCSLCHQGARWDELRPDFTFDHEKQTGVALVGAHARARCLRCHNDRGPVQQFAAQGCAGCHEDVHLGELGQACTSCHDQSSWLPYGQTERHNKTRFPLTGAHAAVTCHRCHPGAFAGRFGLVDTKCATCHADDVAKATNPPHVGLGWTDRCERCHVTTSWNHAIFR